MTSKKLRKRSLKAKNSAEIFPQSSEIITIFWGIFGNNGKFPLIFSEKRRKLQGCKVATLHFFSFFACTFKKSPYICSVYRMRNHHAGAAETAQRHIAGLFFGPCQHTERPLRSPFRRLSPLVVDSSDRQRKWRPLPFLGFADYQSLNVYQICKTQEQQPERRHREHW